MVTEECGESREIKETRKTDLHADSVLKYSRFPPYSAASIPFARATAHILSVRSLRSARRVAGPALPAVLSFSVRMIDLLT